MKQTSIQGNLRKWLLILVAFFAAIGGLVAFTVGYFQAKDLQDDLLEQIATWLQSGNTINTQSLLYDFDDERIIIQPLSADRPLRLPKQLKPGFHNQRSRGDNWRVFVINHRDQKFAIAQQTELREELARSSALSSALPLILLSLILFIGLHIIIRQQLKPLKQLALEVNERNSDDLSQLDDQHVPTEISPFIQAINKLLVRVDNSIKRQQRFIADAAHELRTPVAGLSLLANNLENKNSQNKDLTTKSNDDAALVRKGLNRLQTLVEQLLNLARLQADTPAHETIVMANNVLEEVVLHLFPLADKKNQDLGITRNESIRIIDRNNGLWHIFQNAIGNAIRYTPDGETIDVALYTENNMMIFRVEDNGPGIPEETLAYIFEPFHRDRKHANESNGLGLAICQQIAKANGANLVIENREQGGIRFLYSEKLSHISLEE